MTNPTNQVLAPSDHGGDGTGHDRPALRRALHEIADAGFTGFQLRVNDSRGEWVASAGASVLGEPAPPSPDGHIRIGSNTKTFVAATVLQLVAEGVVVLDAPAADYLPDLGIDPRITVRMLLQHTSGVFNFTGEIYGPDADVEGVPFNGMILVPGIPWQGREWVDSRFTRYATEDLVRLALSRPARFEPGADWSYSNTNYALARLIIEAVSGRTLAEEMHRLVLSPLGLTQTQVPDTASIPEPHAHAYYRYEDGGQQTTVDVTAQDPSWISSGGDMISTTRDLHLFISGLTSGRLLPAPLLAEMLTPHAPVGYGLGVFVQGTGHGAVVFHNGGIAGHGALMYSSLDGATTLTAGLNYVDDAAQSLGAAFQAATQRLVTEVFGDPSAASAG
ncbi:serine hydrolase domain-containing protein [Krasilnikoviella flava]|uniref:D-alanyl-D-alanine carboxypeptidase n=1 Tax=Krasilnikoviella flava TaxID=526729 RepID=A0A1T5LFF5_9MICO|nr:serine hydrolase domain-containing protein [Krasilnikoviella flava]SKC74732.1 D-alanyl-D-alanine carboxypeptidase [Krasilnikoviella flava]